MIEKRYLSYLAILIIAFLTAFSISSVNRVLVQVTSRAAIPEGLLLGCSFEDTFECDGGKKPLAKQGIEFAEGMSGKGIFVDQNDFLEYTAENNFDTAQGTIELWVKPNWDSNTKEAHKFFYTSNQDWDFWIGTEYFNYYLYFYTGASNIRYNVYGWRQNQWHHIAVTWDRIETKLYLDGVYQRKGDFVKPAASPVKLYIGSDNNKINQANAVLDEIKVYNYVKDRFQIKADYDSYKKEETPKVETPDVIEPLPEPITPEEETMPLEPNQEGAKPTGQEQPPSDKQLTFTINMQYLSWALVIVLAVIIIYILMAYRKK